MGVEPNFENGDSIDNKCFRSEWISVSVFCLREKRDKERKEIMAPLSLLSPFLLSPILRAA